jgi:NAD(P)-dependent dehydrogenase (short-subunit alcohol dehydrogenase family)
LDILVNNAGAVWPGGWPEDEPEGFEASLQINLGAVFRLATACRPLLARSGLSAGASVIGVASMASYFGLPIVPGYGAAKAGLVQMTKTLAMAWAADRIRVNAVAPGLTESRMTAHHVADLEALAATLARTPLRRVGQPADVAGAVLFLTSGAAAYITGQTLPVDGGYSIA